MFNPKEFKPRVDILIRSLTSEYQWLSLLKDNNKIYVPLLEYLEKLGEREKNCENIANEHYKINKISEVTGIKYSKITKLFFEIYEDLLDLNSHNPKLFNINNYSYKYTVNFINSNYSYYGFNIYSPVELKKYEYFLFSFIYSKVERDYFFVNEIKHIHEYGETSTFIEMSSETPNLYRELLLDKADFFGKISIIDIYEENKYKLDEKLRLYGRQEKL